MTVQPHLSLFKLRAVGSWSNKCISHYFFSFFLSKKKMPDRRLKQRLYFAYSISVFAVYLSNYLLFEANERIPFDL